MMLTMSVFIALFVIAVHEKDRTIMKLEQRLGDNSKYTTLFHVDHVILTDNEKTYITEILPLTGKKHLRSEKQNRSSGKM